MDNGNRWVEKTLDKHDKQLSYLSKNFHEMTGALKFIKWVLVFIGAANVAQLLKVFA